MKPSLILIACLAATNLLQAEVIRQPLSLEAGDQYRLAFVTSTTTTAESADIEFYNQFVQATADAAPEVGQWGLEWKAIASTATVDARDNTRTGVKTDPSVPIYLVDGTELVPDYATLWSTNFMSLLRTFTTTELGEKLPVTEEVLAWTGSINPGVATFVGGDGPRADDGPLGSGGRSLVGRASDISIEWFDTAILFRNTDQFPVYALSDVVVAVPEPSTATRWSILLLTISLFRSSRHTPLVRS